jgi:hypothetical protein
MGDLYAKRLERTPEGFKPAWVQRMALNAKILSGGAA